MEIQIPVEGGPVSGLMLRPDEATALLVFGHGAGAGMRHPFMAAVAERLADRGVATLRYQFPYMERRTGRPDPQPILLATVRAALDAAQGLAPDLPRYAGGKSMGGRMTSLALSESPAPGVLPGVLGLVLFGFPLHAPGRREVQRAAHLSQVAVPLLFLQGTRDHLADLGLLRPVVAALGDRARLHVVDSADHGFHVLKRSGRGDAEVLDELASVSADWMGMVHRMAVPTSRTLH